ncbi:hypothetical protein Q3G72_025743 [Acer saccharum]|nr:hypothetical protein Q3G72_025743 [Acer saccharum]
MWWFGRKGASGFSPSSTAEQVTQGIHGTALTAIVTGASSGIGTETARVLALRGVRVVMAVRNMEAGSQVRDAIVKENPSAKVHAMELDLSSIASVRKFAADYKSSDLPLSSGIGTETARVLALHGVRVVMAVRNMEAGSQVRDATVKENPSAKVHAMELDLSSIASVRKFAADYKSSDLPLNILINNAGIIASRFMLSKDNIELQFATNYIGSILIRPSNHSLVTEWSRDSSDRDGR